MNKLCFKVILATLLGTSCTHQQYFSMNSQAQVKGSQRVPSSEKSFYHGLENLNLGLVGLWTEGFYSGERGTGIDQGRSVVDEVIFSFQNTNNVTDFMNKILALKYHNKYSSEKSYRQIAEGLLAARKRMRKGLNSHPTYTKEAMLLVELLAEETLYVSTTLFKTTKLIKFEYNNNVNNCGRRVALLNDTRICQGDIIVSKGEAGSSSFLARVADYPGNFSHSTIAYVSNEKSIRLIEAFIEDGVKMRDPIKDYINDKKAKMFIYRSLNPSVVKAGIDGVDRLKSIIEKRLAGKDESTVASFDYDFKMDADNSEGLFCSEVSYYAYKLNPIISASQNPYAHKYWSRVDNPSRKVFLADFLGAKTSFPAPSDIELNSDYEIITMQFNPMKLSSDRMRVALIDVLLQVLQENGEQVSHTIRLLGQLGTQIVDPASIIEILKKLSTYGIELPIEASAKIHLIPKNINYRQLLFFSFLDERLTPEVVNQLRELEKTQLQNGRILDIELMRTAIHGLMNAELLRFSEIVNDAIGEKEN